MLDIDKRLYAVVLHARFKMRHLVNDIVGISPDTPLCNKKRIALQLRTSYETLLWSGDFSISSICSLINLLIASAILLSFSFVIFSSSSIISSFFVQLIIYFVL